MLKSSIKGSRKLIFDSHSSLNVSERSSFSSLPAKVSFEKSLTDSYLYEKDTYHKPLIREFCDKEKEEISSKDDPRLNYPIFSSKTYLSWPDNTIINDVNVLFESLFPKRDDNFEKTAPYCDIEYLRLLKDLTFFYFYERMMNPSPMLFSKDLPMILTIEQSKSIIRKYFNFRIHGGKRIHEVYNSLSPESQALLGNLSKYLPILEVDSYITIDKYCDCYMIKALATDLTRILVLAFTKS